MNNLINTERLEQLKNRLLTIGTKHNEVHELCFPKDDSDGVYQKCQKARSDFYDKHRDENEDLDIDILAMEDCPIDFKKTSESIYMKKSNRIMSKIRKEMIAIIYYDHIMNVTRNNSFSLIDNTRNTINKYSYLFNDEVDLSPLFPKEDK